MAGSKPAPTRPPTSSTGSHRTEAIPARRAFPNIKTILKLSARVEYADRCSFETRYFHLVGALQHRTPRRRGSRPLGGGEHARAARRRVQGRPQPLPRRPRRQKHGDLAPLHTRTRAGQQIKRQRQIQTKSRGLEPPIPPRNPATQMIVNLDSEPWRRARNRAAPDRQACRAEASDALASALAGGDEAKLGAGRYSVSPPSTTTVCPVTIAAPKPRNTITSAISSGVQRRFSTAFSIVSRRTSSPHSICQELSTAPGATAFTRTSGPRPRARQRVRFTTAALLAA